jgi:hypothetical protein
MSALRVTAMRVLEVEGLGEEIVPCSDKEAEHFAVEEQQRNGKWLVVSDCDETRANAERRIVEIELLAHELKRDTYDADAFDRAGDR